MQKTESDYLFITGMGRSGTTFLGNLLAQIPYVESGHEQIGNREFWLLSWYLGSNYSLPFLRNERAKMQSKKQDCRMFVDVNSYLQNSTAELKLAFETENVLHLIRDPKEVVRSIYTRRNDKDVHLLPKTASEVENWLSGDRFYQVCINWKIAMEQLIANDIPLLRFEQLIADYDYTCERLLQPYGLKLTADQWQKASEVRTNKTPSKAYRFLYAKAKGKQFQADELGKFDSWPIEFKRTYETVCSGLATELGY